MNYPAGTTTQMIDERYQEPKGPFSVEILIRGEYDLWDWELEHLQDAVSQAQILEDHHFEWRIVGADSRQYSPNLKPRKVA